MVSHLNLPLRQARSLHRQRGSRQTIPSPLLSESLSHSLVRLPDASLSKFRFIERLKLVVNFQRDAILRLGKAIVFWLTIEDTFELAKRAPDEATGIAMNSSGTNNCPSAKPRTAGYRRKAHSPSVNSFIMAVFGTSASWRPPDYFSDSRCRD